MSASRHFAHARPPTMSATASSRASASGSYPQAANASSSILSIGRPHQEGRRRSGDRDRRRCSQFRRPSPDRQPARRNRASGLRRDALRDGCRDRVRTVRAGLEAANAVCQSVLPEEAELAPFLGAEDRRDRPARRPGMVRLPPRDAGRRRPVHAGALAATGGSASCPTKRCAACRQGCGRWMKRARSRERLRSHRGLSTRIGHP